jgi:hypothetical protein
MTIRSMPRIPQRAKYYVIYRNARVESDTTATVDQNDQQLTNIAHH